MCVRACVYDVYVHVCVCVCVCVFVCLCVCVRLSTDCVRRVKAALVMEVGRCSPLVISLHSFLLMTSTRPPFSVTSWYSMYRSSTCLAMMGMRFTGVPGGQRSEVRGQGVTHKRTHIYTHTHTHIYRHT